MWGTKKKFITKNQYQNIADLYNLGKIKDIKRFKKGFEATKAAVLTPKGKYVFSRCYLASKKHPIKKTKKSLLFEIDLVNSLENLPVNHYLKSKNGLFIESHLDSFVIVCNYLPDKHPKSINPKKAYELGKFLGNFHKQGKNFKKECPERRKFYELTPYVVKRMDRYAHKQKNPLLKKFFPEIRRGVLKYYLPTNLPRGPVHVDIKLENELFISNRLTGILDFGISYIGPLILDIGKGILWNCTNKGKIDSRKLKMFMKGYLSQRSLSKPETNNLKKSILFGIYAPIYVDLFHLPFKRAPQEYCLFMIREWSPLAKWIKNNFKSDKLYG